MPVDGYNVYNCLNDILSSLSRCLLIKRVRLHNFIYGPFARYLTKRVAHAPRMPGTFSPPPRVIDPNRYHGTCVIHVPWCIPGSITSGLLWSRWRAKRSWRMRNLQVYACGKRPMAILNMDKTLSVWKHKLSPKGDHNFFFTWNSPIRYIKIIHLLNQYSTPPWLHSISAEFESCVSYFIAWRSLLSNKNTSIIYTNTRAIYIKRFLSATLPNSLQKRNLFSSNWVTNLYVI